MGANHICWILFPPEILEEDTETPTCTHVCRHTQGCEGFVSTAEQDGEEKEVVVRRRSRSGITGEDVFVKVMKVVEQIWKERVK